jgi:hypothetical protein
MMICEMCRQRFAGHTSGEVEAGPTARGGGGGTFKREGEVAEEAMEEVMEEAAKEAADVAVGKMHAAAAKKAVEAVAKEAAMSALREICHEAAMASLEAVPKEAAKVTVCELRQSIIVREARAQMYMDDAATEEERVATDAEVTAAWVLFDDNKMKVEDNEDEAEVECDALLHAAEVTIRVAAAQRDAELAACAAVERQEHRRAEDLAEGHVKVEAELAAVEADLTAVERVAPMEAAHIAKVEVVERDTAERAAHWADEIDKALAYRRDVNRREAGQTLCCQDAAIRAAMAAIDGTGPAGNDDGAAQL